MGVNYAGKLYGRAKEKRLAGCDWRKGVMEVKGGSRQVGLQLAGGHLALGGDLHLSLSLPTSTVNITFTSTL